MELSPQQDVYYIDTVSPIDYFIDTVTPSAIQLNKEKTMSIELDGPLYLGSNSLQQQVDQNTEDITELQSDVSSIEGDIGSLDNLATSDKSSLVNAINETLSVLDPTQTADYIKNSKGLESGEISTNASILPWVEEMYHSTFDRSKFTVVGSPIITDDGIASGFSGSNYIKINQNIDWSKPFMITARFKRDSKIKDNARLIGFNGPSGQSGYSNILSCSSIDSGYNLSIIVGGVSTSLSFINNTLQYIFEYGKYYDIIISFDGIETYNLKYKESSASNYISCDNIINSGTMVFTNPTTIGYVDAQQWDGSFDLKQFSITVDGVPVFSGNKTGLDVIKLNDYTVYGSPSITFDGIASGFSGSNYLTKNPNIVLGDNFEIEVGYTINSNVITSGRYDLARFQSSGNLAVHFLKESGSNVLKFKDADTEIIVSPVLSTGNIYKSKVVLKNGILTSYCSINNAPYTQINTITTNMDITSIIDLIKIPGSFVWEGSVDLNVFKIYVDGDLVYQSCLRIPYVEAKTGSKVVNSLYRSRVYDMYEQFGYAPYYTLSNTDFTLPRVELYGLIGQRTLRDSYRNGINYWELYSNRDLEQGGSCTSGVEVTFTRPFADTNYVLSVPYSAKSSTAFTPTQTGDWIAKGKGLL